MKELLGLDPAVLLASFLGGVVAMLRMTGATPWRAVAAVMAGCFTGAYIAPIVGSWLLSQGIAQENDGLLYTSAFIVGLSGMSFCNGIIAVVEKVFGSWTPAPPQK